MAAAKRGLKTFSGELQGSFLKGERRRPGVQVPRLGRARREARPSIRVSARRSSPAPTSSSSSSRAPGGRAGRRGDGRHLGARGRQPRSRPTWRRANPRRFPAAEAIVIADEAGDRGVSCPAAARSSRSCPPSRETPIGLLRLEADVAAADHEGRVLPRGQAPGLPARSRPTRSRSTSARCRASRRSARSATTLSGKLDRRGRLGDQPGQRARWPSRSCRSRIPRRARCGSRSPCSRSPGGVAEAGRALPRRQEAEGWTTEGPYEVTIPMTEYSRGGLPARHGDRRRRQEANDIRFLKGPNTTIESVRVDVVQLHISAIDKSNRFVKGLTEKDFAVQEDGRPQDGHGLRGRREAAADDRARRRRLGLDGKGDAVRARGLGGALPAAHPATRTGASSSSSASSRACSRT